MTLNPLGSIALILGLGVAAQWVSWRLKLPSILFLLLTGLLVGPFTTIWLDTPLLDIEHLLGELLFPVVSASVAIILFEGGLSLRLKDIRGSGKVVGYLVTVGVLVTWLISAVAARYLFDMTWGLSLLIGATLVVTGPTVIIPLIKQIRPKGRVGSILRWEGIIIDPVGAILAVLVFEELLIHTNLIGAAWLLAKTLLIGFGIALPIAQLMIETYRRYWVPDHLQNPITLGLVLVAFAISNTLQPESGLLTVTLMGIIMANQNRFDIRHIIEFKETLQILLLSSLFIMLAARLQPNEIAQIGWATLAFVAIMVFIERPLAVFLSTWTSDLNWREKLFLAWMAPRGIVAAAVASIFAIELQEAGYEGAEAIVPIAFAVIIMTVATYSLTAGRLAQWLGLAERNPQGVLFVGGTRWIRAIAKQVQAAGFRVLVADSNQEHIARVREEGLDVYHGSILSEAVTDEIDFAGLGRLVAMTPNSEVNALASENFEHTFGVENVYELQNVARGADDKAGMSSFLGGRKLFTPEMTYDVLSSRHVKGAHIETVVVGDAQALMPYVPQAVVPLFIATEDGRLLIWSQDDPPRLQNGQKLIAMIDPAQYDTLFAEGIIATSATVARQTDPTTPNLTATPQ
jgi:NhaP-type Na+/H+ or K+/H+ antiporter